MSGIIDCFKKLLHPLPPQPAPVIPIKPLDPAAPVALKPSGGRILMIDVSHYEPVPDYAKLVLGGVRGVYAKASEHAPDSLLKDHVHAAQDVGLLCGAYHFMHASGDGEKQADLYLSCVKDLKLELKHCLDWEGGSADGMSSAHQQSVADAWLSKVESTTGRVPCIYGGESFLRGLKLPVKYARFPLWLAHYDCAESHLIIPFPWGKFAAWQYTDALKLSGLSGGHTVDASYAILNQLVN